jgi:hypothetical protein
MHQSIRLRPAAEDRLLGGGNLLNLLGQIKALIGAFNVEVSRLREILPLYEKVVDSDYSTVVGMRQGLTAVLEIADILVLEDQTVTTIRGLLESDTALGIVVWLYVTATGHKESDPDVLPLMDPSELLGSFQKWLPLVLQLIEFLKLLRG